MLDEILNLNLLSLQIVIKKLLWSIFRSTYPKSKFIGISDEQDHALKSM